MHAPAVPLPSRPRSRPCRRLATAALVVALVELMGACASRAPATVAIPGGSGTGLAATVTHVVDGDTIDVEVTSGTTERVRILGVDTPETVKPNTPVQCYGPEASARTKALLPPGTGVVLQRDQQARDVYGRLLAYVFRRSDGLFIDRSLAADGYARILSIAPNVAHRADLSAASAAAQARHAGLWGRCGPPQ